MAQCLTFMSPHTTINGSDLVQCFFIEVNRGSELLLKMKQISSIVEFLEELHYVDYHDTPQLSAKAAQEDKVDGYLIFE